MGAVHTRSGPRTSSKVPLKSAGETDSWQRRSGSKPALDRRVLACLPAGRRREALHYYKIKIKSSSCKWV